MERTEIQEFRSQDRRYQVHTRAHARGYTVQVFAGDRPIGPRYSVEFETAPGLEERGWARAAGAASEVLADIAMRAVGWRGPGA